jgi:sigma-B regulation protein RsbU (phosphoserine phosphatase)
MADLGGLGPKAGMTDASASAPMKGSFLTSFRTKFIALLGSAVLASLLLGGAVALWNVAQLSRDASTEIETGLTKASEGFLESYIDMTAQRADLMFARTFDQVNMLAHFTQRLVDEPKLGKDLGELLNQNTNFQDSLVYEPERRWLQNRKGEPSVISVWSYLLDGNGKMRPDVEQAVRDSTYFDLIAPSLMGTGQSKLQMYYVGPKERPIMRTMPYSDQAQTFDKLYPGHNDKNWWDFFFPGVYEAWQGWLKDPSSRPVGNDITVLAPYVDAITGQLIVSYFQPIYNKARSDVAGMVGVDITLDQLTQLVQGVKIADTGFAFLAQQNGNVLTVKDEDEKLLGLTEVSATGAGVTGHQRSLFKSSFPDIANLRMPRPGATTIAHVTVQKAGKPVGLLVVMHPLQPINMWQSNGGVAAENLMLGFVVPEREVYASLYGAQKQISSATSSIIKGILGSVLGFLALVLLLSIPLSRRFTAGLVGLADAAGRLTRGDYDVQVPVKGRDEVAMVGTAFNSLAREIRGHTEMLEQRVAERTSQLASANDEIQRLYDKMKDENLRLGAELDVARKIQMMVMPAQSELERIPDLDIASYAEPAEEVGGDYYDVLYIPGGAKIGIGDVTGHGVESGVLMLMVQSVSRALYERGVTDPREFLDVLNRSICKNVERTRSDRHLSLAFVDYADDTVTISGQHEEVIIIRSNGAVERLDTMDLGFPIGLEANINDFLASTTLPFNHGDTMVLFTDGITEAESEDGRLYGTDKLIESALRAHKASASSIAAAIIADVRAHIGKQKVHDDITLVVMKHR